MKQKRYPRNQSLFEGNIYSRGGRHYRPVGKGQSFQLNGAGRLLICIRKEEKLGPYYIPFKKKPISLNSFLPIATTTLFFM